MGKIAEIPFKIVIMPRGGYGVSRKFNGSIVQGPFITRTEAQAWIDSFMKAMAFAASYEGKK